MAQTASDRRAIPPDYDAGPERFRLARRTLQRHGRVSDIHGRVAERLLAEGVLPVLDVGCGEGELARHLPRGAWVGVDNARRMLERAPQPAMICDADALPFPDDSFGSLALLYVLYHLDEPRTALAEAHRVLRAGGMLAVAAPSRDDSPELAEALPQHRALSFDAEIAPELLGELFGEVEIERWDAPLIELPDPDAVRDYLVGKGADPGRAARMSRSVAVPMAVTKRGALAFARKARAL